jgi:omega-amidase
LIKLAVLQWQIAFGNIQENRKRVLALLSPLEDSLVVLPEMFPCGFDYDNLKNHARESQRLLEELRELSKEKRLTLIGTYPEEREGKLFNTAFVLSDGLLVGKRDKIKLFPLYREGEHFSPGQENPVFETRHGKVGVLVCFELRFPNLGWELRKKGAQIIAVPSLWGAKRKEHLRVLSQARAGWSCKATFCFPTAGEGREKRSMQATLPYTTHGAIPLPFRKWEIASFWFMRT